MDSEHPARRIAEAAVAAVLLALALPIVALAALVSALTYRAWPFFVQDRVGLGGRTFRLVKVRSLPPCTDAYADKYSIGGPTVPRHMRELRRLHLDELPQLWHVVAGQMGFIGPRPEMPNLHARFAPRFAAERVSVRPGLTGLWQISPHCDRLIGEHPEYDRLYLQHRTSSFDAWILWRTLVKVALGRTTQLYEAPRRAISTDPVPLARFEIVEADVGGVVTYEVAPASAAEPV